MTKQSNRTFASSSSAISSELIVSDSISIDEPKLTEKFVYYIERRPQEAGRCVIVRVGNNTSTDILPAPYSARSRVHEYGGGSYCIGKQQIFFINDSDQDIYCLNKHKITRITMAENQRFADFCYDQTRHCLIAICETHANDQVNNSIVSIDINSGVISVIEEGNDFYASPRLNSAATQLCWQTWNHPNMPWDGNQLWLASLNAKGEIDNKKQIAGADDISVFQPRWSPDDILYFISDDSGWWHLYRYLDSNRIEQLTDGEKEFGLPQWVFAESTYAFIDSRHIICSYQRHGKSHLASLLLGDKITLKNIQTSWHNFNSLDACQCNKSEKNICFIAASSQEFPQLITASFTDGQAALTTTIVKTSCQLPLTTAACSVAETITFKNRHKQNVFANYYPAINCNKSHPPPLIVICHGGPTGQSSTALDPKKQFWTSRGFALLDVNYSGSTGYGREYRSRLNGKWGVLDVEDCCDAALYAVSQGLADGNRLIIRGSSAGGYTVLSALTFARVFSAGASYYGISELNSLACDTHKFESRYLDRLIGPYPEARALYDQRSPINSTDKLNCPVIFFQGIEDKVVPKEQAEKMFDALKSKGVPVAAQFFPGEQHGFRKAETVVQSLENEFSFYQRVLKLKAKNEIHFTGEIKLENI